MTCLPEVLKIYSETARGEIGEAGVNLQESVEKLKEILAVDYGDLRLPPNADHILERGLRYRKFNLPKAANHIHLFFKLLKDLYGLHGQMYLLPSILQDNYYECFGVTLLKNRDSKGHAVIFVDYDRMPTETYNLDKLLAAFMLIMDEVTKVSVETQRLGLVVVCNLKGYGFGHAKHFTISRIKVITRLLQGAFPARYKGFHIVRTPSLFMATYAIMKPFLSEKIKKRIHLYGNEFTELYGSISPEILPDVVGGNLSCEEAVDVEFTRRFSIKDNYYKELFKYGYMANEDGAGILSN